MAKITMTLLSHKDNLVFFRPRYFITRCGAFQSHGPIKHWSPSIAKVFKRGTSSFTTILINPIDKDDCFCIYQRNRIWDRLAVECRVGKYKYWESLRPSRSINFTTPPSPVTWSDKSVPKTSSIMDSNHRQWSCKKALIKSNSGDFSLQTASSPFYLQF